MYIACNDATTIKKVSSKGDYIVFTASVVTKLCRVPNQHSNYVLCRISEKCV